MKQAWCQPIPQFLFTSSPEYVVLMSGWVPSSYAVMTGGQNLDVPLGIVPVHKAELLSPSGVLGFRPGGSTTSN